MTVIDPEPDPDHPGAGQFLQVVPEDPKVDFPAAHH